MAKNVIRVWPSGGDYPELNTAYLMGITLKAERHVDFK